MPRNGAGPVFVYDPDSFRLLAAGTEEPCADGARAFSCTNGNGALLAYYFGRGKRLVMVRHGANEGITCHLGTRWCNGRREWLLD